jgi:hypothetical protein
MKFHIPKENIPYRIMRDIEIELVGLDSDSRKKMQTRGFQETFHTDPFYLHAKDIIKITTWSNKQEYVKIRILSSSDKLYEKLCGYVRDPSNDPSSTFDFLNDVEIEEIPV